MRLVVSCAPASSAFCPRSLNLGLRMVPVSCSRCWCRLYCSLSSGQVARSQLRAYDRIAENKTTDTKATGQRAIGLSCHIPLCVAAYAAVTGARETLAAISLLDAILVLLRAKLTCGGNTCYVCCYKNTKPKNPILCYSPKWRTFFSRTQKNNLEQGWPSPVLEWSVQLWNYIQNLLKPIVLCWQHNKFGVGQWSDCRPQ